MDLKISTVLCRDRLKNCQEYKKKGLCELVSKHMEVLCKLTCDFCGKLCWNYIIYIILFYINIFL